MLAQQNPGPAVSEDAMKLRIFRAAAGGGFAGRIISRRLTLALVGFVLSGWSAAAQTTSTYWYTGNPFNLSECLAFTAGYWTCPAGRVTATVTFTNLPIGATGAAIFDIAHTGVVGTGFFSAPPAAPRALTATFSISALGLNINNNTPNLAEACVNVVGSEQLPGCGLFFTFSNGSIVNWDIELVTPTAAFNFPYNVIKSIYVTCNVSGFTHCGQDFAANLRNNNPVNPNDLAYGFNGPADPGVWSTTQPTCADIVMDAVPPPVLTGQSTTGEPTMVSATFTPNYGMTLQQAADICKVKSFNWIQQVTISRA